MIDIEHLSRLGEAMKDLRWAARLTQTEVRDRTGMSAPQLSRYENGHETPSLESLVKYLAAVGADLGDLQRVLVDGVRTDVRPADAVLHGASGPSPQAERRVEASAELLRLLSEIAQPGPEILEGIERRLRDLEARVQGASA